MRGAILIYRDDCELIEVVENLLSNEINIGEVKEKLLDPTIDIADYFDWDREKKTYRKIVQGWTTKRQASKWTGFYGR